MRHQPNCNANCPRSRRIVPWLIAPVFVGCLVLGGLAGNASADEGFEPIFDGETLDGWAGEEGRWRVEDGHIIGETTEEDPLEENTFLIWEGGEPSDFELKFRFRIDSEWGNSGIQVRSERLHDHVVRGYQPDIATDGPITGMSYEERGRGLLAPRGSKAVIDEDGETETWTFASADGLAELFDPHEWTEYHVIAEGNRITTVINGHVMSEIVDYAPEARDKGIIAFQLHSGQPMTIRFDDVQLKNLRRPLFDGETLDGWDGDPEFWRVEDGHIIGETTEEGQLDHNTFLIWEDGEPSDFDLQFRYRIDTDWANSGVQVRSERVEGYRVAGYQPDIATDDWITGIHYEEMGRGILTRRGQSVTIGPDGERTVEEFADEDELFEHIHMDDWNDYRVRALGNRIVTEINGVKMHELIDDAPEARRNGVIAFQLHTGPAMRIRFDDITLREKRTPIFDGESLEGWDGDPEFWRVEDGHIIGETTEDGQLEQNTFLIWEDGEPADFDLAFRYRIDTEWANSGVQVRSERLDGYRVGGYQPDIATVDWITGIHYEEAGRGILARRGQRVTFDRDGEQTVEEFADEDALFEHIHMDEWNDYRVKARGNRILTEINGVKMHEIIDDAPEARRSGVIAFQLHTGPAMRIRFNDIRLKELPPLRDGESLESWDGETDREEDVEPLESHTWEDRPVVIFAPSREDATYQRQMESFEEHADGLDERDIALYRVFETGPPLGPEGPRSTAMAKALRERFDPEASFLVILVGKDTTEKLRRDDVLSAEELFETIDAMPMRRREMQRQDQ